MNSDSEHRPRVDMSVLVPVYNEASNIRDATDAMREQSFPGTVEFLLLEGRSEDDTKAILEEVVASDSRFRLLDNAQRTTPHALNLGLREARGAFVARMDAHTLYEPDYLARGVERLRQGGADWVSGPAIPEGTNRGSRRVALALSSRLGTGGADFRQMQDVELRVDTGFAGVWWRETLLAHGGWDERWPINQDAELAARFTREGQAIVCLPSMAAKYHPRATLRELGRQYARYGFYRARTSRRHPASMRPSHLLPPGLVLVLVTSLAGPRSIGRSARNVLALYVGTVAVTTVQLSRRAPLRDTLALPVIFVTMHVSWGAGFLALCLKDGPPTAAIARLARSGFPRLLGRARTAPA